MSSSNEQCALCKQCDFAALEKRVAALEEAVGILLEESINNDVASARKELAEAFAEVEQENDGQLD